jgi:hypothetical protein
LIITNLAGIQPFISKGILLNERSNQIGMKKGGEGEGAVQFSDSRNLLL